MSRDHLKSDSRTAGRGDGTSGSAIRPGDPTGPSGESAVPSADRGARRLLGWLTLAGCIVGLHALGTHEVILPQSQWDFDTYYFAWHVYEQGGNPYEPRELTAFAGRSVWPWAYPPHTLHFFGLFADRPLTGDVNVAAAAGEPAAAGEAAAAGASADAAREAASDHAARAGDVVSGQSGPAPGQSDPAGQRDSAGPSDPASGPSDPASGQSDPASGQGGPDSADGREDQISPDDLSTPADGIAIRDRANAGSGLIPVALSAKQLYLLVKIACLALLTGLWLLVFVEPGGRGWFLAFAALGFNAAIGRDLMAGNVTVFEQLAIWIGVAALLWRLPAAFCVCIILAGQFKLLPLGLLGLLWFVPWGRRWRYVVLCAVLLVANAAAVYLLDPQAAANSIRASADLAGGEYQMGNSCSVAVLRIVAGWLFHLFPPLEDVPSEFVVPALYVGFAAITLLVTMKRLPLITDPRIRLFVGIATYMLLVPRIRDYSWTLMLVPGFELARAWIRDGLSPRWILGLGVAALALPGTSGLSWHGSYLLAWILWAVTLYRPAPPHQQQPSAPQGQQPMSAPP